MKFGAYEVLNALWLLIPLCLFMRWAWKSRLRALGRFGDPQLVERLAAGVSRKRQKARLWLMFGAFALALFSLARPLWGEKEHELFSRGHDIMIALDVSKSMRAEDIRPNRLAKAKQEIHALFGRMEGNRIGLVIFGGEAFMQCPLTLDYSAARILLGEVEIGSVPSPGTAISRAIEKCLDSFPPGDRESRAIILITDGEDTVGDPQRAAERAAEEGVLIYAIGIGDPLGVPIPVRNEEGELIDYVKDRQGNVVTSKLDEETLRNLCLATGGAYFAARADSFELDAIYEHLERRRAETLLNSRFVTQYEERYQYFLFPALLLLVIETAMSDRKKARAKTIGGYAAGGDKRA